VRCGAETNKELTFSPSLQIDTIDIDRDEELRASGSPETEDLQR
jgi:hypothetical protein